MVVYIGKIVEKCAIMRNIKTTFRQIITLDGFWVLENKFLHKHILIDYTTDLKKTTI